MTARRTVGHFGETFFLFFIHLVVFSFRNGTVVASRAFCGAPPPSLRARAVGAGPVCVAACCSCLWCREPRGPASATARSVSSPAPASPSDGTAQLTRESSPDTVEPSFPKPSQQTVCVDSPKLPWQLAESGLIWRARRKKPSDSWRQQTEVRRVTRYRMDGEPVADLVLLQFSQDVGQREHDGGVAGEEPQRLSANQLRLGEVT